MPNERGKKYNSNFVDAVIKSKMLELRNVEKYMWDLMQFLTII